MSKIAERRMFAKTIIDSDAFLDMPATAQLLYFHLAMRADDDGFVNKPKTIMRMTGCKDDDLNLLFLKKFLIPFETGIVVIKHWKIHNYIRSDRYKETKYKEEKAKLSYDENNSYTLGIPTVTHLVDEMDTQDRLGKDSINNNIMPVSNETDTTPKPKKPTKHKYGEFQKVRLTDEELQKLNDEYGESLTDEIITYFDRYIEEKHYKSQSHYLAIKRWVFDAVQEKKMKKKPQTNYREKLGNSTDDFMSQLQQMYNEGD